MEDTERKQPRPARARGPLAGPLVPLLAKPAVYTLFLAAVLLAVSLWQTWPLAAHLDQAIPRVYQAPPEARLLPEVPGDHLQTYYWFWLFEDNVLGPSSFPQNPYEFSTNQTPRGLAVYANFPLSVLYLALSPLGPIRAYNLLVLLSYLLAGLAAFALARRLLDDPWAAVFTGLVFAFLPLREAKALSGHIYGFAAFLLPLTLWLLEEGWKRRSILWGAGAGLAFLSLALLENHLVYYGALTLAVYVPLRLALLGWERPLPGETAVPDDQSVKISPRDLLPPLAGALGLALAAGLTSSLRNGTAFWSPGLAVSFLFCLALATALWVLATALGSSLCPLPPRESRRLAGRLMAFPALAFLYPLGLHLGSAWLGAFLALLPLLWALPPYRRAGFRLHFSRDWWKPLLPLAICGGMAGVYLLWMKSRVLEGSIAAKGRSLSEVRLYAPSAGDILSLDPGAGERMVYLGPVLLGLALLGLARLAGAGSDTSLRKGQAALWAVLGFVSLLLCLGPNLPQLPLYQLLYDNLPFFNFPRVPGRLALFAALFLALLGGWGMAGVNRWLANRDRPGWLLPPAVCLLLLLNWWPSEAPGLCLIPPAGKIDQAVTDNMPTGPGAEKRLLGLPIWPGDSHQSSIYELTITRTRAVMINGYAPAVPLVYRREVFDPLYPLDLGQITPDSLRVLDEQRVDLVAFHDDPEVYPPKISPFPPALARERLEASGRFTPLAREGKVFLYRFRPGQVPPNIIPGVSSPVTAVWEAERMRRRTGQVETEEGASGWTPEFRGSGGNLVTARAGRDPEGLLFYGVHRVFPPGRYQARFRLRRGSGGGMPGRVEVMDARGGILAQALLLPELLPPDGLWHDLLVDFSLDRVEKLDFLVHASGRADLSLDVLLVSLAGEGSLAGPWAFFPAARLWRECGGLAEDGEVPGGLAVTARAGYDPPMALMTGPNLTLGPGRYRAVFRLAGLDEAGKGPAALLRAGLDQGRRELASRTVPAADLGPGYRDLYLEFRLEGRAELDLRVIFLGGRSLKLAGAGVELLGSL